MIFLKQTLWLLFFGLLAENILPQGEHYFPIKGNIDNSFTEKSFCTVPTATTFEKDNTEDVLDSLICVYLNGDKIKIVYNYNDDLTLDYFTFADWFNGEWIIFDKRTNTYNSYGNLESVLWEWFNSSSGEWLNDARDVYYYDSLGNQTTYLHQLYDGQEFINDFRYEYFFNTINNVTSSLEAFWNNGKWVNDSKSVYTYTPKNLIDTALFQVWTNEQWINYQMNILEYDEELNIMSNLAKRWEGNNWLNLGLGTYEYDINNNRVLEYWKIAVNNNWENWFRIFYEYDDKYNLIHLFGEEWVGGQWVPEDEPLIITNPDGIIIGFFAKEIFQYYSPPTSVENENNIVNGYNLFQNFPNPFNPSTSINFTLPEGDFINLEVFNVLGEKVKTLVNEFKVAGMHTIQFEANELANGTYLYVLRTTNFTQAKKMILLK
jgi:hypothetical protein